MLQAPNQIQLIGNEVAIAWPDGAEDFFSGEFLRKHSPSAANQGEVDVLGQRHGGDPRSAFPGVTVNGWEFIGNYAVRFIFSDGHQTGIYSWSYLRELRDRS